MGGLHSVVIGDPGVGKSVLREHIDAFDNDRENTVVSCSRTMHTYLNVLRQLAESFKLQAPTKTMETALIQAAYHHVRERKTLYILIDEAHLLDMQVLRKLRLLFERFPKKHNLILFGQRDLHITTTRWPAAVMSNDVFHNRRIPRKFPL